MNEKETKNSKVIKGLKYFLQITIILQGVILFYLAFILVYKVIDYKYLGETQYFWQKSTKCNHSYGCKCPKGGKNCTCIYYDDENSREEKVQCRPVINYK